MNESINDEAVHRTAPATPGLLINQPDVRNDYRAGNFLDYIGAEGQVARSSCGQQLERTQRPEDTEDGGNPHDLCRLYL